MLLLWYLGGGYLITGWREVTNKRF
eukprot:SAG31_NODE_17027_length_686_cov_0.841567_1_plen_24_part_01